MSHSFPTRRSSDLLRGYGRDANGGSFADYGLTIKFENEEVEKCILHMYDRNVDIEYLKGVSQPSSIATQNEDWTEELQNFARKWFYEMPRDIKMAIARETDKLNTVGGNYYEDDDYINAILFFNKALDVMPTNGDALKNLVACYKITRNFNKMQEIQNKLDYLIKHNIIPPE